MAPSLHMAPALALTLLSKGGNNHFAQGEVELAQIYGCCSWGLGYDPNQGRDCHHIREKQN